MNERISLQFLWLVSFTRCYFPVLYIIFSVLSSILPLPDKIPFVKSLFAEKPIPSYKKIYNTFKEDRKADIKAEDVKILHKRKYDKYRYLSKDFIERNGYSLPKNYRKNINSETTVKFNDNEYITENKEKKKTVGMHE